MSWSRSRMAPGNFSETARKRPFVDPQGAFLQQVVELGHHALAVGLVDAEAG